MPDPDLSWLDEDEDASEFTGDIIVLLEPDTAARVREALGPETHAKRVTTLFLGGAQLSPVVTAPVMTDARLKARSHGHRFRPSPPSDSLLSYFRVRSNGKDLAARVDELRQRPEVETVYAEMTARDPVTRTRVRTRATPTRHTQKHLQPAAEGGIDARWMWSQPCGRGEDIAVVDIERAWNLGHEALAAAQARLVWGYNLQDRYPQAGNHGTATLGVLVAGDNGLGVAGIAPGVRSVGVSSRINLKERTRTGVADAIVQATRALLPGDVLLIEVERGPGLPTEIDRADFLAIQEAVDAGLVVIEAGGNAGVDLDTYEHPEDGRVFQRDSGAILVAAAEPDPPHHPLRRTNYGRRIDCYAHGDAVITLGRGDLTPQVRDVNALYTNDFEGTSAAAAIIAGAAVLVQGWYKEIHGRTLGSREMRQILADRDIGTPHGLPASGPIGVMPNLRAITEKYATPRDRRM